MANNAAAALLKGATKKSAPTEAEETKTAPAKTTPVKKAPVKAVAKPAPEPEPVEETVQETVEIEKMTEDELDQFVQDNKLDIGDDWDTYDLAQKVKYLNDNYGSDGEAAEEEAEDDNGGAVLMSTAPAQETEQTDEGASDTEVVKAKTKTAAKSKKAAATTVVVDAQLDAIVSEVENLKEDQIKGYIASLNRDSTQGYLKMAGALSVIQANGWYEPFSSFKEYVEVGLDLKYRRIQYHIASYNAVVQNKIPLEDVVAIGWTKLKEVADILTPENVAHWVEVCKTNNTYQVKELVKAAVAKANGTAKEGEEHAKVVMTLSFKVHSDQKETITAAIEKAKTEGGSDVAAVALEYLCADYLAGGTMPLHERLAKIGVDNALDALKKAYPNFVFEPQLAS